jgi:hypothetical protein
MRGDATLAFEVDSRLRKSNSGATRRWRTKGFGDSGRYRPWSRCDERSDERCSRMMKCEARLWSCWHFHQALEGFAYDWSLIHHMLGSNINSV